jgi:hypothetical protein
VEGTFLKVIKTLAYNITDRQISGGPSWMTTERFDIEAKAGWPRTVDELHTMLAHLPGGTFPPETSARDAAGRVDRRNRCHRPAARIAQGRFEDVRGLATSFLFDFDAALSRCLGRDAPAKTEFSRGVQR